MARTRKSKIAEEVIEDEVLVAEDEQEEEELVDFQASGEASSVPDPVSTGSSKRKADKSNGMPMQKLDMSKVGMLGKVVDAFSSMTPEAAGKAYKGIMDSAGNKSSITAKGDAKAPVKLHAMAAVKEDLEQLFKDSENLTEDFFDQASVLFESALGIKAKMVEEELTEQYEKKLQEAIEEMNEELEERLSDYLEYVAQTWMEENEIAIESALKVEMAENFLTGIKGLFEDNNIEVDDEAVDHVAELEAKVTDLQNQLDESVDQSIELKKANDAQKAQLAFNEKSSTLTLKQRDEFEELVEGLSYDSLDDYVSKMDVIIETVFNKPAGNDTAVDDSEPVDVDSEDGHADQPRGPMAAYAQAISRTKIR